MATLSVQPLFATSVTKEPFLCAIQKQRAATFNATQEYINGCVPAWEEAATHLNEFYHTLHKRGSDLQNGQVKVPPKKALEADRDQYLTEYWGYQQTCMEIGMGGEYIQSTIVFLTPQQRTYTEARTLETDYPDVFAQIRQNDELCRKMVGELGLTLARTTSLRERIVTLFLNKVNQQMDRFCKLVDNGGAPLSGFTRGLTYASSCVANYEIPKPKSKLPGVSQAPLSQPGGPQNSGAPPMNPASPDENGAVTTGAAESSPAEAGQASSSASGTPAMGPALPKGKVAVASGVVQASSGEAGQASSSASSQTATVSSNQLQAFASSSNGPSWSQIAQKDSSHSTGTMMTSSTAGPTSSPVSSVLQSQSEASSSTPPKESQAASGNSSEVPHVMISAFLASKETAGQEQSPGTRSSSGSVGQPAEVAIIVSSNSKPSTPSRPVSPDSESQQSGTATASSSSSNATISSGAQLGTRKRQPVIVPKPNDNSKT